MDLQDFKVVSDVSSVLDQMMDEQTSTIIKSAIQELNPQQQTIITLYYYDCLSLNEIAEIVAISVSTIKVNLFRARKRLYELLKNHVEFENRMK